jgi:hypothetical protein
MTKDDMPLYARAITTDELPHAVIVKETFNRYFVRCPHCGDLHKHGKPLPGEWAPRTRAPHCGWKTRGLSDYLLVHPKRERDA